jgi:hypothetical protein
MMNLKQNNWREKLQNYKKASQAQLAIANELSLSKKWF